MKVILVNPNANIAKSQGKYSTFGTAMPPMGLAYLATVLYAADFKVKVIDQYVSKIDNETLIKKVTEEKPQLIGISCLTAAMGNVYKIVSKIRNSEFKCQIVLGNIHASLFTEQLLKEKKADVIVRGEGEETFLELANHIRDGNGYNCIKGLSFRIGAEISHNPDRQGCVDIDKNPFPNWDLVPYKKYNSVPLLSINNEIILHIQASRGCPYRCFFCSQEYTKRKTYIRDTKRVVDEIEYQSDRYKAHHFAFVDSYFPMTLKQGFDFSEEMIKRNLHKKIKWAIETRVDKVNFELLRKMKEAGLSLIMYGFESGNQDTLDRMNKQTTLDQAREVMNYTKRLKISSLGFFILGLPGENRKKCLATIRFAKEMDCDLAKFNIAVPYPGSEFFRWYEDKIDSYDSEKFSSWYFPERKDGGIVYTPEGMTSNELLFLQSRAMFSYYVRPKIIWRSLFKKTISWKNIALGGFVLVIRLLEDLSRQIFICKSDN